MVTIAIAKSANMRLQDSRLYQKQKKIVWNLMKSHEFLDEI